MKIKMCVVVIGDTVGRFIETLKKVQQLAEMVELRLDVIKGLGPIDLAKIRNVLKVKAIAKVGERTDLINELIRLNFDFVDIDIEEFETLKTKPLTDKLIISYHDFKKTPDVDELTKIFERISAYRPFAVKIAVMINTDSDLKVVFGLMSRSGVKQRRIIIGMGGKGRITRVAGPYLGNYLAYASTESGKTAPGQIELDDLKDIYQLIGPEY